MAHHNLQCKRVHARIDAARAADCSAVYQEKRPKTNTHCHTRSKTRLSIGRIAGSRVSRTQRPAAGDGSAAHTADCSAKENPTLARHTADCSAKERAPELTLHAANCSAGKSEKFTYLQLRQNPKTAMYPHRLRKQFTRQVDHQVLNLVACPRRGHSRWRRGSPRN